MTFAQAQARHAVLVDDVRRYDRAYYVEGKEIITNYEYDQFFKELLDLEQEFPELVTPESPSQRVGGAPMAGFKRVKHLQPMLSLEKIEASEKPDQKEEPNRERRSRLQDEYTVNGYYLFTADDFTKPSGLVTKLRNHSDPVSEFLWNRFSTHSRQVLNDSKKTIVEHRSVLVRELNEIVQGKSIYSAERFSGVDLPAETLKLKTVQLEGGDLIRFNRRLLERSYDKEGITKRAVNGLKAFDEGIRNQLGVERVEYVVEPKVDGVSISVHYRNGKLAMGVTRGDGETGDDITANIKTIRGIPLQLITKNPPALLEVRGEAYIATKNFEKLNAQLAAKGDEPFPNARNATAGTLKQLDPRLVAQRPISAVFYAVGACEGISFKTHSELLEALKEFGLPTQAVWWVCRDIDEVLQIYADEVVCHYDEDRDLRTKVPYEIDGIVLKVNNTADAKRIPAKTRVPGDAIVHKPVPWITPAETLLKAIKIQVGRTGVLTPVAELEPVFIQGSTISRATLHNEDEIRRKDIRIGDTVVIRKAGMVIPEVVEVLKSKRPKDAEKFDFLEHTGGKCPACGGAIAKEKVSTGKKEEVAWRCQNVAGCPAQKTRRVEYFAQRKALDIESLGDTVAEKLVESGLISEPLDLFDLSKDRLAKLNLGTEDEPRVFGEKNALKIIEALERARTLPLHRWIMALAIPEIGEQTAFDLAGFFPDLPTLAASSLIKDTAALGDSRRMFEENKVGEEEKTLPEAEKAARKKRQEQAKRLGDTIGKRLIEAGFARLGGKDWQAKTLIGPVAAKAVVDWAASSHGRGALQRMQELRIAPQGKAALPASGAGSESSLLTGKTFVLTGTLPTLSRDDASRLIRDAGGSVTASVSKNTDYLLVGEDAGSKLAKAIELGIKTLTEEEFLRMLNPKPQHGQKKQEELFE